MTEDEMHELVSAYFRHYADSVDAFESSVAASSLVESSDHMRAHLAAEAKADQVRAQIIEGLTP